MNFLSDLRLSIRSLRNSPGFAVMVICVLAIAIGANTAIVSIVNAVLLRPLPFSSARRLVAVNSVSKQMDTLTSYPDFQDFRNRNSSFNHLAAYREDSWTLTRPGSPAVSLSVEIISSDVFPMLDVQPIMGRTFYKNEDEDTSGPMSVVISARTWRNRFASDPQIVGRPIVLRGLTYIVIGVMPESFNFPVRNKPLDAWSTFGFSDYLRSPVPWPRERGSRIVNLAADLKPGVTLEKANSDLATIAASLAQTYPATDKNLTVRMSPLLDRLVQKQRSIFLLLLAAVGCVLLIACANVANLSLVRATTRRRELAIRLAVGAGRMRVIRQVLTESVLLSMLGGLAGLVLGAVGSKLLSRFSPIDIPRIGESNVDLVVFLFTIGASLLTGIAFGVVPALRASETDPAEALKEGGRGAPGGQGGSRTRNVLIVSEVAMALMLLTSAGLLIRSLFSLNRFDPGFQSHNVLTSQLTFPATRFSEAAFSQAMDLVDSRLRLLPGVVAASDVAILPLSKDNMGTTFEVEGHPLAKADQPRTRANIIGTSYLPAMEIPLLAGREFTETDTRESTRVILVNKTFAQQFFPNQDPIGKQIRTGLSAYGDGPPPLRVIVGVVGSVAQSRIGQEPLPEVFFPRTQLPFHFATLVVKTRTDPRSYLSTVESTFHSIDNDIPLEEVHTLDELVSLSLAQPKFLSGLFLTFAAIALVLTSIGLYGVITYSVSQRTHEIATRRALGAPENNILKLVLGRGLLLAAVGIAMGLGGALAVSGLLRSLLYEVKPTDVLTLGTVAAVVFVISLLASFIPAWRATRIDPMIAFRYE